MWNHFILKKPDTYQKTRQFPLRFYIQKSIHFTLRDLSWNFWIWHLYPKSMTFWVTWHFYIQKARHFAKSKTIYDSFLYTKIMHFTLRDFLFNFWNLRRGGGFIKKQCTLCDIFILKKQCTLRYIDIQRAWHYALHFNIETKWTFCYIDIYIIYINVTKSSFCFIIKM